MDVNEKELRQLQTALKNHEAVSFCRKAPRQFALLVDFRGHSYRVDFAYGWQADTYKSPSDRNGRAVPGPDLAELQALIPVILKVQQDKEMEAIAKAEAAKAKEQAKQAKAEAEAETRKLKTRELREACTQAFIPGFNSQQWSKEKFGEWNFGELALEELEILWAEMKRRAKDWQKNPTGKYLPVLPGLSWESEEAIAQDLCMDENSSIEEEAIIQDSCMDEKEEVITLEGKALTLKQPWAWAVFNCGKNIENRSWDTSYRGRLFIHAGQTYDHSGAAWIAEKFGVEVPGPGNLPSGAIVGWVELTDVVTNRISTALSDWAITGQFHWVLKNPQPCEPVPWKGQLGLFDVEIPFPAPPQWILDNAQALWDYGTREIPNGKPYRPSNGSEGDWFMGGWCEQCSRLNSCSIPVMSMAGEQPPEWVYWSRKPICLAWDEAIADKPLAYYPYQGLYKVGDAEGNLEEFESAEEAIEFINNWGSSTVTAIAAEAKTGKSLAFYQIAEEVTQ